MPEAAAIGGLEVGEVMQPAIATSDKTETAWNRLCMVGLSASGTLRGAVITQLVAKHQVREAPYRRHHIYQ